MAGTNAAAGKLIHSQATRETADTETPARLSTSRIVAALGAVAAAPRGADSGRRVVARRAPAGRAPVCRPPLSFVIARPVRAGRRCSWRE
ncbi:hypothetical protein ACWCQM_20390 [Streptomyces sp. NPDC002125]